MTRSPGAGDVAGSDSTYDLGSCDTAESRLGELNLGDGNALTREVAGGVPSTAGDLVSAIEL